MEVQMPSSFSTAKDLQDAESTDRSHAVLSVESPTLTPEQIAEASGVQPDVAWHEGQVIPGSARQRTASFNRWEIRSPLDQTHQPEEHVEALLKSVQGHEEAFRRLSAECDITLQVVVEHRDPDSNLGHRLEGDLLQRLAALGASLDLDEYDLRAAPAKTVIAPKPKPLQRKSGVRKVGLSGLSIKKYADGWTVSLGSKRLKQFDTRSAARAFARTFERAKERTRHTAEGKSGAVKRKHRT
jgi:hypothetical protein